MEQRIIVALLIIVLALLNMPCHARDTENMVLMVYAANTLTEGALAFSVDNNCRTITFAQFGDEPPTELHGDVARRIFTQLGTGNKITSRGLTFYHPTFAADMLSLDMPEECRP